MSAATLAAAVESYARDGFCYVRGAVAKEDVDALVDELWRLAEYKISMHKHGVTRQNRRSWPTTFPLLSVGLFPPPSPTWTPLLESPELAATLDALLGHGTWEIPVEQYQLYFPIKLPQPHDDGTAVPQPCNNKGEQHKGW